MLTIGCHLSVSKGYLHMGKEALSIGANTFQFFSRNPRGGGAKKVDPADAAALAALMAEHGFGKIVAHAPYILNLASAKEETRAFGRQTMLEDLQTLELIPGQFYNFHPGSHGGHGLEHGIRYVVEALNEIIRPDQSTTLLLETMAGKGSEIGGAFEELRDIIAGVEHQDKIGVCLDTCHVFDGGYDIVNDLDWVLNDFDRLIGLNKLKALHLNDSKNPFGSHKDRHAGIGEGSIGLAGFRQIVNHPLLKILPMCLETPQELPGYAAEIRLLRSLEQDFSNMA